MDFLSRHYEKMILGACLVFLILGLLLIADNYEKTQETLKGDMRKSERRLDEGSFVEPLDEKAFAIAPAALGDRRRAFDILGLASGNRPARPQGSLLSPSEYICCKEDDCRAIILMTEATCPFCKTEQPPLTADEDVGEDTDGDGIPDAVEKKYPLFLSIDNSQDARQDYDNDGFLNVEEYRAGTAMDNPYDYPDLGTLLRFVRVFQYDLKIQLRDIDRNGLEDSSRWNLGIRVERAQDPMGFPDPKRSMNRTVQLGATIRTIETKTSYRVSQAGFENVDGKETPFIVLENLSKPEETYKLYPEQTLKEKTVNVEFIYLANRNFNYAQNVWARFRFRCGVGQVLPPLSRPKFDNPRYTEHYKLESATMDDGGKVVLVRIETPRTEPTEKDKRLEVPKFEAHKDFYVPMQNTMMGGEGGMMGPGGGGPMMQNPGIR